MIYFVILIVALLFITKVVLKWFSPMYDGVECLVGKVAIVTGGNKGIGYEVSKHLASRGCKVIIACRSDAENERNALIEETCNKNIFVKHLNLQTFESVRNFAKEIHDTEEKLDILINNAGIGSEATLTVDGLNPVMQTNTFSPFLLTCLLIDLLKKSNDGRIVFVSSIMAFYSNLSLSNINPVLETSPHKSLLLYGNSKLATAIISRELAKRLAKYGVKSNAIHPGMVYTNIWQSLESWKSLPFSISKWILYLYIYCYSRTTCEGAQEILELAISNIYKNTSGQFYYGLSMANIYPNPLPFHNQTFCDELWKKCASLAAINLDELE